MALTIRELQKIHGICDVLSRRVLEAGLDTFAKIAAAGEEGLGAIPGTNPKLLTGIVELWRQELYGLATLVLVTCVLVPVGQMAGLLYLLVPLK